MCAYREQIILVKPEVNSDGLHDNEPQLFYVASDGRPIAIAIRAGEQTRFEKQCQELRLNDMMNISTFHFLYSAFGAMLTLDGTSKPRSLAGQEHCKLEDPLFSSAFGQAHAAHTSASTFLFYPESNQIGDTQGVHKTPQGSSNP